MAPGVYIHIPFCASKCRYCDFYSRGAAHAVPQEYVQAVIRELRARLPADAAPCTVYFGGGTPSLLSAAQAAEILRAVHPASDAEITLEANPDTVDEDKLAAYREAGINRISFGVQTAHDDSLRRLGRLHTAAQSAAALTAACKAGFTNISGDIMLALPHYSLQEMQDTITLLAAGGCSHISAYMLKIEPGTPFGRTPPQGLPDDDEAADFYLAAVQALAATGYAQYEISNFAKAGFESKHNLLYWNCDDYLGIGPAAHSCMGGRRFSMPADTEAFIAHRAPTHDEGAVSAQDYIMLRLRLANGLDLRLLQQKYGIRFTPAQMDFIHRLAQAGDAVLQNDVLRLTPTGMLVQNSILCELL